MAPIHFPSRPRLLPIPGRLRAHTHAIPILVDHTLPIPLLVILSLIAFPLTCTIFACWIPARFPYALSILPVPILLYPEPHTLLSAHDVITPYPYRILGW
jgi:hypothetical protein